MAHFISTTNVCRTYIAGNVETHAVEDVDLAVEAGEVVVLLGPSGSGKSTLLIVTHNPVLVQAADRVITMRGGRVTSNEVAVAPVAVSEIEW